MGYKSLLVSMEITTVARTHKCRYNKKHTLRPGERRLTVKVDRSEHHYCLECAKVFLQKDCERLRQFLTDVEGLTR